jgi:hypothetical protein
VCAELLTQHRLSVRRIRITEADACKELVERGALSAARQPAVPASVSTQSDFREIVGAATRNERRRNRLDLDEGGGQIFTGFGLGTPRQSSFSP